MTDKHFATEAGGFISGVVCPWLVRDGGLFVNGIFGSNKHRKSMDVEFYRRWPLYTLVEWLRASESRKFLSLFTDMLFHDFK